MNCFGLATGHQHRSGSGLPCRNLLSPLYVLNADKRMTKPLCQGYLTILVSVWSLIPDLPPFWKTSIHWCNTPLIAETFPFRSNRLALLHCHHILFKDHYYPYKDLVTSFWGFTIFRTGYVKQQTVVSAVYPHPGLQLEPTNILTTVSYQRHVYESKLHNVFQ